jgi:hypothetical protein
MSQHIYLNNNYKKTKQSFIFLIIEDELGDAKQKISSTNNELFEKDNASDGRIHWSKISNPKPSYILQVQKIPYLPMQLIIKIILFQIINYQNMKVNNISNI